MEATTIKVEGMSCGHCVAGVKRALEGVEGVEVRGVEIGSATVGYDPARVTVERIISAVEAEGYGARIGGGSA